MSDLAPPVFEKSLGLRSVNWVSPVGYGGELTLLIPALYKIPPRKLIIEISPMGLANQAAPADPKPKSQWIMSRQLLDRSLNLAAQRVGRRLVRMLTFSQGFDFQESADSFFFTPFGQWMAAYPPAVDGNRSNQLIEWQLMVNQERRHYNLVVLSNQVKQLRERGWKEIVVVRTPISPSLLRIENQYFPSKLIDDWCVANKLPYFDYSAAAYQPYDGSHLGANEALRFSRQLANDLRKAGW